MNIERKIIEDFAAGSHSAFRKLFNYYYPKVHAFVMGLTKDKDETDDLVQAVFIKLWNKREYFLNVENFDSYLFTLVKYTVFNSFKEKSLWADSDYEFEELDAKTPYDDLLAKDLALLVEMVVENMPAQRQAVYKMSREMGMSNDEIALKLGIQKKTVENHLNLALKELRKTIYWVVVTLNLLMN